MKAEVTKITAMQNDRPNNISRSAFDISLASIVPFVNGKDLLRYPQQIYPVDKRRNACYTDIKSRARGILIRI